MIRGNHFFKILVFRFSNRLCWMGTNNVLFGLLLYVAVNSFVHVGALSHTSGMSWHPKCALSITTGHQCTVGLTNHSSWTDSDVLSG